MQRFYILGILCALFSITTTAQNNKATFKGEHCVTMEVLTGTWCGSCPSAVEGIEGLLATDAKVAIIEYHVDDDFEIPMSEERQELYNIYGVPIAMFDGTIRVSGANLTQGYINAYEECIAKEPIYQIDLEATVDAYDLSFEVDITKLKDTDYQRTAMYAVMTESEIPFIWQHLDILHFVARDVYPSKLGQKFLVGTGEVFNFTHEAVLATDWAQEHLNLVVFVQDLDTKEILGASQTGLSHSPVNVHETIVDSGIVCSPNPVMNNFSIKGIEKLDRIVIRDLNGRILLEELNYMENTSVDLSNFDKGIYLLEMISGDENMHRKLLKN